MSTAVGFCPVCGREGKVNANTSKEGKVYIYCKWCDHMFLGRTKAVCLKCLSGDYEHPWHDDGTWNVNTRIF